MRFFAEKWSGASHRFWTMIYAKNIGFRSLYTFFTSSSFDDWISPPHNHPHGLGGPPRVSEPRNICDTPETVRSLAFYLKGIHHGIV